MADIRIKDLATTASSTASDDFLAVDGSANGTRKLNAYSPTFGGNLTVSGTGDSSFAIDNSHFLALDSGNLRIRSNGYLSSQLNVGTILASNAYYSTNWTGTGTGTFLYLGVSGGAEQSKIYLGGTSSGTPTVKFTLDTSTGATTLAGNLTVSGSTISLPSTSGNVDLFGRLFALNVSNETRLYAGSSGISLYDHVGNGRLAQFTQSLLTLDKDTTVGGNLTVSGGTATVSGSSGYLKLTSTGASKTWDLFADSGGSFFIAHSGVLNALQIAPTTGNATFTGNLSVSGAGLSAISGSLNVAGVGTFNKSLDSITTETDYAIRIKTSAEDGGLYLGANSTISAIQAIDPGTTFARNLAIQSQGGNVLIGTTTNDTGRLQVNGTATVVSSGADQRTFLAKNSAGSAEFGVFGSGKGYLGTTTNDDFEFYSNNALALTLTTTGNLRAGSATDANNARIYSYYPYSASGGNAAIGTEVDQTGALRAVQFANPNGIVGTITTSGSATSFNTSSDLRLKTNIAPAGSASALIDSIQIVQHDWKAGGHVRFGVIAQDIQTVAPEVVFVGDDGEEVKSPWGVDYSKLVPALIKEVQTLRARVAALESV